MSAGSTCTHPWKEDFGFKINESVGASVKNLPNILKGFLDIKNQDNLEEGLKEPMNICIRSLDCKLYTVLDKNNTNLLTMCVVTKKVKKCIAFTCTCPNLRNRRSISTAHGQVKTNHASIFGITNPTCKIKSMCDERICDTAQRDFTITENESFENPVKYTTTIDRVLKENNIGIEGNTTSTWLYFLIFVIGVGIGTVTGSLATFLWFKRKYLLPKTSSVVNRTYNREKTTTVTHDVTEYSEIPECSKTTYYEPIEDFHHQESFRNITHSEFRDCPSLVTHVNMCEHSFKSGAQKKQDHMNDMDQKKKLDLLSSGNSNTIDGIANKEGRGEYLVPLRNTNIVKIQENMVECPYVVGAMNHSSKEESTIMTHTVQEDTINSTAVYFELSAASENEKPLVPECTNFHCEDHCKKDDRLEIKHVNPERNAASECEKGDKQPTENVYFELSKSADCLS